MEGLEISEVMLSKLERTKRMDSEFYERKNIEALENLIAKKSCSITDFISVSDGNHMTISDNYCDDGIPYYRGTDIYNFFIEQSNSPLKIERQAFDSKNMQRSHLKKGDVLMSIVGAIIGNLALVTTDADATCSCKLAIMRPSKIEPAFLAIYLKSYYGQNQIQKLKRGAAQTGLILEDFDQILMPAFSDFFQKKIQEIINSSYSITKKSTYSQAENLLLNALGMANFSPSTKNTNEKSFKDSFLATGRLDAEYYQPFYEEVEQRLKSNSFELLENICSDINYGTVPTSPYTEDGSGIPYIKGMNIKNCLISGSLDRIENTEGLNERFYTKTGDIIISQMGTVGDVGVITESQEGWLFASFTIRIRLKNNVNFNPYFVGFYIQNFAKPYYLMRNIAQASVRQNTDLPTIKNLYIPLIDFEIQNQIADLIQQSFSLKAASEHLLETAKRAVEIAIETDEQTAMAFINSHTGE